MKIKEIKTGEAPEAIGPYSQAVIAGDYVFISGQLPVNPATGKIDDGIREQTSQVIDNLQAILAAQGVGLDSVVKAEVYLSDLENFQEMNAVYASRFTSEPKPARQAMQVARLPLYAKVEISAIAYLG